MTEKVETELMEQVPEWLRRLDARSTPAKASGLVRNFFASKVVFYPGSRIDVQPAIFLGSIGLAHCFVYADYSMTKEQLIASLDQTPRLLPGYRSVWRQPIAERYITPGHWRPNLTDAEASQLALQFPTAKPFALLEIVERDVNATSPSPGPDRLAILFLGAEGCATFDALFCQDRRRVPHCIVIQDHGWGGNPTVFGKGGMLERLADATNSHPPYLYVSENSELWPDYVPIEAVPRAVGGEHQHGRLLYARRESMQVRPSGQRRKRLFGGFSLPELIEEAGLDKNDKKISRQIRYLIQMRIMSPPEGKTRAAQYSSVHLEELKKWAASLTDTAARRKLHEQSYKPHRSLSSYQSADQVGTRTVSVSEGLNLLVSEDLNLSEHETSELTELISQKLRLIRGQLKNADDAGRRDWQTIDEHHLELAMQSYLNLGMDAARTEFKGFRPARNVNLYSGDDRGPFEARVLIAFAYRAQYPDRPVLEPRNFTGTNGQQLLISKFKFREEKI